MLFVKKNSNRLKEELQALKKKNRPLLKLVIDLYHWIEDNLDKDVVITMIGRTQDEQDAIYKDNERYQKKKFKSPHQFAQAIDLRSWIYNDEELDQIVKYLNDKYNNSNYYKWTAKVHKVGDGAFHFHIQYYQK